MIPQKYAIVCLAQHSWESAWARPQHLMSRFARDRKVLFVRPISVQHVITKPYERRRTVFRREGENLYIYSPIVLPWGRKFPPIRRLNEFIIKRLVRRKIRQIGIEKFTLWIYAPVSEYLVGKLGESMVVYDCTDAWWSFGSSPKYFVRREKRLSQKADVLFAGTAMIFEEKKRINPNTHLFTCGVDYDHFSRACTGADEAVDNLKRIPRPIVGYYGLIDKERMDIKLIDDAVKAHPEWSFVFIGPVQDREFYNLQKHSNVYFTGLVSYDELPDYLRHFDVATIPYAIKNSTKYINPTKLLEYMAAGKPVISSDIPEIRNAYKDRILFAKNTDEFVSGIEGILDGSRKTPVEDNRAYSAQRSWEWIHGEMERLVSEKI